MIVALARKLLIALWRLVTTGQVSDGIVFGVISDNIEREGQQAKQLGNPCYGLPMESEVAVTRRQNHGF